MTLEIGSYEEAVAAHEWRVPERYNIAADCCDKHPADKLAMIHEDFDGTVREIRWGELQEWSNRFANVLRAHGVQQGDRVAMLLPPTPETAAAFFGTFKSGAILLSMSVLYGDDGIRHRVSDSEPKVARHQRGERDRASQLDQVLILDDELLASGDPGVRARSTRSPTTRRSSTTPPARPGWRRASCTRTATCSRTRSSSTATTCRTASCFHGMGEWAWAAGIAPLLGPWRLGAVQLVYQRQGGFDPHKQLDFLSRHGVTNVFTTPTAMRSMMSISDAGTRYPQKFRLVCSAGEPLNPEAIRWFREQYGLTVLDYYGLTESYPLVANYPFMDVREGSMGRPMPGWDVQILDEDERPVRAGRARRDLPARAVEPALSARLLAQRRGGAGDVRRRLVPLQGRRADRRGRLRLVRGPRRRRDHRRRLPDRPVRGRVRLPRARRGRRGGRRRVARRAARQRRQGVHRARRRATRARTSWSPTSRSSCASGCPPTRTRARSSSSTSCRRRSPARSAGSSCASRRWNQRS